MEKLERQHELTNYFSRYFTDNCVSFPRCIVHGTEDLLKQRVFALMQGYEDTNSVFYLQNDPVYQDILGSKLTPQPTLSRFENSIDKRTILKICYAWIERYVSTLKG